MRLEAKVLKPSHLLLLWFKQITIECCWEHDQVHFGDGRIVVVLTRCHALGTLLTCLHTDRLHRLVMYCFSVVHSEAAVQGLSCLMYLCQSTWQILQDDD